MILAADVGGTKTDLALYTDTGGQITQGTFSSHDYDDLESLIRDFLQQQNATVQKAVLGVPGPVLGGQATLTNLPWELETDAFAQTLRIKSVKLLNDLEAMAYAIPYLEADDVQVINEVPHTREGNIGLLAPGTGLGQAFLIWDGEHYTPHASEGGHRSFAPHNKLQIGLLEYLLEQSAHVSTERVCSGSGIPNLYAYLKESGIEVEPDWLCNALERADDPVPVIFDAAQDTNQYCSICKATISLFIDIMAAEAGNMALTLMTMGGIYLGGGIPRRISKELTEDSFMPVFQNKGRMSDLLKSIPVYVILHPQAALLGAAHYAINTVP